MKCPNCKFDLPDDSEFCSYCGIMFATIEPKKEKPPEPEPPMEDPKRQKQAHAHSHRAEQPAPEPAADPYAADVYDPYGLSADPYGHTHAQSKPASKSGEKYCEFCGGRIDRAKKKCTSCGKHYPLAKTWAPYVLLGLMLVASLLANLTQYNNYRHTSSNMSHNMVEKEDTIAKQTDELSRSEDTISSLQNTVTERDETIKQQQAEIEELGVQVKVNEEKAGTYDKIHDALTNTSGTGHGTVNFHASESVIFLSKSEKNRTFTLTADLGDNVGAGVYYMPETGMSARVKFDTTKFAKTTTMTVVPYDIGMTTVTFFNDKNSEKFNVIIIVTE